MNTSTCTCSLNVLKLSRRIELHMTVYGKKLTHSRNGLFVCWLVYLFICLNNWQVSLVSRPKLCCALVMIVYHFIYLSSQLSTYYLLSIYPCILPITFHQAPVLRCMCRTLVRTLTVADLWPPLQFVSSKGSKLTWPIGVQMNPSQCRITAHLAKCKACSNSPSGFRRMDGWYLDPGMPL